MGSRGFVLRSRVRCPLCHRGGQDPAPVAAPKFLRGAHILTPRGDCSSQVGAARLPRLEGLDASAIVLASWTTV
jgi:hypothetical protein